jgi:hypothetical protein
MTWTPTLLLRVISVVSVLVLSALDHARGDDFELLRDQDLPGNDIRTPNEDVRLRDIDLDACKNACLSEPACRSFTYNQNRRWCFLKGTVGTPISFVGAISGNRKPVGARDRRHTPKPATASQSPSIHPSHPPAKTGADGVLESTADIGTCEQRLDQARALASRTSVSLQTQRVQVGAPLVVSWIAGLGRRAAIPLFLVIKTPSEVRFKGRQLVALTPDAKAPFNIRLWHDSLRAFVALHREGMESKGQVSVLPYRTGTQALSWAIVAAGDCGEQVLRRGSATFDAVSGAPELEIHDAVLREGPSTRIRSRNGKYDLLVFDGRYEVYDSLNGAKILDRAGTHPNFSPTGRFVAARRLNDGIF